MVRAEHQDLSPSMSGQIRALKAEIDQGIRRLLREGVRDGSIQPLRREDDGLRARRRAELDRALVSRAALMSAAQIADAFVNLFEQGLRPRDARREPATRAARAQRSSLNRFRGVTMSDHNVVIVSARAHSHRRIPGRASACHRAAARRRRGQGRHRIRAASSRPTSRK